MACTPDKKPLSQFIPTLKNTSFDDAFKREIYQMFHRYILRPKYSKMWGFPYVDDDGKVRYSTNHFFKLKDADTEKCRCGKQIFLQGENWHLDEKGCEFHPGKVLYSDRHKTEVFSCCHRMFPSSGCARRNHHVSTIRVCHEDDFVRTKRKGRSYLPRVPNIFALDCEMVYTTRGMEVVKVTVLTVFCDVVYDTFVKPRHPVIDYNTEFSGIGERDLADVTVELSDVQADLLELFDTETILVGHGLENDLLCLNLCHSKIIDTSVLFPHKKGFPFRHSLKTLAMTYLNKEIHCGSAGHDSKEDARTCIELVALKVFFTKKKEMKRRSNFMQQVPSYSIPGRMPNFGSNPWYPMNWNSYYASSLPPPNLYASFLQSYHPLLSFPLYLKKINPIL